MSPLSARIALFVGATVFTLGLAEGVVRVSGRAPSFGAVRQSQHAPSLDPELIWVNAADALDHNALGLRGAVPEVPKSRPRVLVLGDSIAYGYGLAPEDTIPQRLGEYLASMELSVEVLNGGTCGYDSRQEARWLELRGDDLEPDAVVVLYCMNDALPSSLPDEGIVRRANTLGDSGDWVAARRAARLSPWLRATVERSHLARLLLVASGHEALQAATNPENAQRLLLGDDLSVPREGLARIAAWCRARDVRATLAIVPWIRAVADPYSFAKHHAAAAAIGAELGLDTIDLLPAVRARKESTGRSFHLPDDPIHPDPEGARIIARVLAERLAPTLRP